VVYGMATYIDDTPLNDFPEFVSGYRCRNGVTCLQAREVLMGMGFNRVTGFNKKIVKPLVVPPLKFGVTTKCLVFALHSASVFRIESKAPTFDFQAPGTIDLLYCVVKPVKPERAGVVQITCGNKQQWTNVSRLEYRQRQVEVVSIPVIEGQQDWIFNAAVASQMFDGTLHVYPVVVLGNDVQLISECLYVYLLAQGSPKQFAALRLYTVNREYGQRQPSRVPDETEQSQLS